MEAEPDRSRPLVFGATGLRLGLRASVFECCNSWAQDDAHRPHVRRRRMRLTEKSVDPNKRDKTALTMVEGGPCAFSA